LRAKVVIYVLGGYKVFIESIVVEKGSFDWKLEGEVPLLMVESDWKATNPLPISPNTSNQNFEIAILFNVFERSRNYVFEDNNFPSTGSMILNI